MIVDTGEFEAIRERVDVLDVMLPRLAGHAGQAAQTRAAYRIGWDAGVRHARVLDVLAAPAGRHAAPRRDRRGLRLVQGGRR